MLLSKTPLRISFVGGGSDYFNKKSLFFGGVNCAGINDAVGDSRRGGGGEIF